mmetsp:Transcript_64216/g.151173  ORF Transcript_64216/g.151173 Transcript_64216/m.151173 type:complete len:261 (-) Transcript_64216:397-1179(-)
MAGETVPLLLAITFRGRGAKGWGAVRRDHFAFQGDMEPRGPSYNECQARTGQSDWARLGRQGSGSSAERLCRRQRRLCHARGGFAELKPPQAETSEHTRGALQRVHRCLSGISCEQHAPGADQLSRPKATAQPCAAARQGGSKSYRWLGFCRCCAAHRPASKAPDDAVDGCCRLLRRQVNCDVPGAGVHRGSGPQLGEEAGACTYAAVRLGVLHRTNQALGLGRLLLVHACRRRRGCEPACDGAGQQAGRERACAGAARA